MDRGHLTIKVPICDVKEVVPTNSGVCQVEKMPTDADSGVFFGRDFVKLDFQRNANQPLIFLENRQQSDLLPPLKLYDLTFDINIMLHHISIKADNYLQQYNLIHQYDYIVYRCRFSKLNTYGKFMPNQGNWQQEGLCFDRSYINWVDRWCFSLHL